VNDLLKNIERGCLAGLVVRQSFFAARGFGGGAIEGEKFTPLSLGKHAP